MMTPDDQAQLIVALEPIRELLDRLIGIVERHTDRIEVLELEELHRQTPAPTAAPYSVTQRVPEKRAPDQFGDAHLVRAGDPIGGIVAPRVERHMNVDAWVARVHAWPAARVLRFLIRHNAEQSTASGPCRADAARAARTAARVPARSRREPWRPSTKRRRRNWAN